MEEQPSPAKQNPCHEARSATVLCVECQEKQSKYKCPGCSLRTCSLPCVKSHKLRTGCSGKREVAPFIPISQFDDNTLLSDYNFLEEVKRVADAGQRMRSQLRAYPQYRLPHHLKCLKSVASSRKTNLMLLPSGMSRRDKNQTRYDQRKKLILWTVEWRFHSTGVVTLDHGVDENASIFSEIHKHLQPGPWKNQLKQFCEEDLESLKCFIRKYPKGKSPFRELDIKAPLREQIAHLSILEYPVIHVYLPSHSYDFEVVKDLRPVAYRQEPKSSIPNDQQIPKGVTFKEEEIEEEEEENGCSEVQVYDLAKKPIPTPGHNKAPQKATDSSTAEISVANDAQIRQAPEKKPITSPGRNKAPQKASNSSTVEISVANDAQIHPAPKDKRVDEMDFNFDPSLLDSYSDILDSIDTEDFLDFEGELTIEMDGDEEDVFGSNLSVEELEEGEIPD
ncbi:Box C/D snoRNA protein 1 [Linum perenne]